MNGPCLCGDIYCAYCGQPGLAQYEALCDAMVEKATSVFPKPSSGMIDYEELLCYIVEHLLNQKAKSFVTALCEEFVKREKEVEEEQRYAEQLAQDDLDMVYHFKLIRRRDA